MRITVSSDAGVVQLHVAGELDMATAHNLHKALRQAVTQPGTTTILIDFDQVSFCDSSGLEALDRAYGEAIKAGITLRLLNPQPNVRRIFDLTCLLQTLTGSP
ncbi:STAS domain-containing protein [Actinoplanes xinjiangensis]|uniref:STAS domain-containing protein n=1 Tax=Actinoplanes xinjiangensis TaxID=512350 RepID=UPI00343F11FA